MITNIRENFAGDPDVKKMLRRFELAIKENGWRGNVEDVIGKEMRDDDIESQCLKSVKMMSDEEFEIMFASAGALGVGHASSAASYSVMSQQERDNSISNGGNGDMGGGVNQQASFVSALGSTELL